MNPKDFERFYSLRERLFRLINKADNGYHKSYEGAVDIRYCFENIYEANSVRDIKSVEIELYCYLLVNGRHITWDGKTLSEALDKFESWLANMEECIVDDFH